MDDGKDHMMAALDFIGILKILKYSTLQILFFTNNKKCIFQSTSKCMKEDIVLKFSVSQHEDHSIEHTSSALRRGQRW
jgi:hypothetical protein